MKRIQLFAIIGLLAVGIQAQTYHPFVEAGKRWKVHGFSMGSDHTVTDYGFSDAQEYISHDGHEYFKFLAWRDNQLTEVGELREEDRRVYFYDTEASQEYMIYDFSLKAGDTFHETRHNLTFTVDSTDQMIVNGDTLKTLHLSALDGVVTAYWVEGVGNTSSPLENFYADTPNSWSYRVAYVAGSKYWPFTFGVNWNGWWGTQLKTFGQENYSQQTDSLNYELVKDPDRDVYNLHVYGWQRVTCGPNHYINCIAEPTEDLMVKKLKFQIEDVEPLMDCKGSYYVDCSFPYFEKERTYIVTDSRGDHVVSVSGLAPYRPFIEEGKVWKVGWFPGAMNRAKKLDYYYFEGDTIINNRTCKKMRCRHEAAEGWGSTEPWTEYVGALYEEERRVYCAFHNSETFELLYDFSSAIGTTLAIHGGSCIVAGRGVSWKSDFKGNYTSIALYQPIQEITGMWGNGYDFDHPNYWYEGLGRGRDPLDNSAEWGLAGNYYILINCTVGDEVISQYPNPHFVDDVTPSSTDVKKQWIDFTHIKKPRPKAPARMGTASETAGENLTGEYSAKNLFVSLKILSGPYTVTLKDAAGNEVYRKEVQTSSTIALNTDLTKYPEGTYTLVVENSEEQYTATLTLPLDEVAVRDIPFNQIVNGRSAQRDASSLKKSSNCKWYDLSGRPISTLPAHGIFIRNGKKVLVK